MATLKAKKRQLGRRIRKATGLKLPIAMELAKHIVRGGGCMFDIPEKLQEFVGYRGFGCGPGCCGLDPTLRIFGPKTGPEGIRHHEV